MTSTTETGHGKNVTLLEQVLSICTGFGTDYAPVKVFITLPSITTKHTESADAVLQVQNKYAAIVIKVDKRSAEFQDISELATKIKNAVIASDAPNEFLPNIVEFVRKLQGKRAKTVKLQITPTTPEAEAHKKISVSQLSYDMIINHFSQIVELLSAQTLYNPNEDELKVITLKEKLNKMKAANTAVMAANTDLGKARNERDKIMYHPETGIIPMANDIKAYVKSKFGGVSAQFKMLSKIQFKKPKKVFI
ncbi:MAG: hypothetical protein WCQ95_05295 [Bacteroidota bacterium]